MSPPLPAEETYAYAGIASYASPGPRRADGTVQTKKQASGDGSYKVITLRPNGGASGMFFSVRSDDAPSFSETDAACWRWQSDGSEPPRKLEMSIGGGRLEFVRGPRELRQPVKNDKLLTESVYDRVTSPSDPRPTCSASAGVTQLFAGSAEARVAFTALREREMRAFVLDRKGGAEAIEIGVDGTQLRYALERGCWSLDGPRVRVALGAQSRAEEYEVADEGLRPVGAEPSRASAYRRAR